jgi:hypothetical protein
MYNLKISNPMNYTAHKVTYTNGSGSLGKKGIRKKPPGELQTLLLGGKGRGIKKR